MNNSQNWRGSYAQTNQKLWKQGIKAQNNITNVTRNFSSSVRNSFSSSSSMPSDTIKANSTGKIWMSPSTGKYYKKVGLLWKQWKGFNTLESAQKAGRRTRKNKRSSTRSNRR